MMELTWAISFTQMYRHWISQKWPKEYLQDKPLDPPLEKISRMAVTQVAYDSALIFELRDADNFELKKIESGTVVLWSGKSNRLQNTIPEPIIS